MTRLHAFYAAIPNRKVELIDDKLYVAGSLDRSAIVLHAILAGYGAAWAARQIPKELLRQAIEEVYPAGHSRQAQPPEYAPAEGFNIRQSQINSHFRMSLFQIEGLTCLGNGVAMKLGDDVFMPGAYVVPDDQGYRLKEYYLDGPAPIILEFPQPATEEFDRVIRLPRHAAAGVPELWLLDQHAHSFTVLHLREGRYEVVPLTGEVYSTPNLPGIHVRLDAVFADPWNAVFAEGWTPPTRTRPPRGEKTPHYHSVPFAPRLALDPVPIAFEEYIAWGGEPKFEWIEGRPLLGGGYHTTEEYLGLLLMTLGVRKAVSFLPKEAWAELLKD